jgi:hypothetical protein
MKVAKATIVGVSPYSQSRHYSKEDVPAGQGESPRDYESRTWRHRLHVNSDGFVFIPPMAFKNCVSEAAKFLSIGVPGGGKSTYTKHFESGILVVEPIVLKLKAEKVEHETLFVPSNGIRGSGKRVEKVFPLIREWGGPLNILVFDETVLNAHEPSKMTVLEHVLRSGGLFIGVGRFRPRNNGFYGRYDVTNFSVGQG